MERRRDFLRVVRGARLVTRPHGLDPPELGDAARGRDLGETPGQEVVARIATLHVDDVAFQAELLDVVGQDDLHHCPCT